MELATFPFSAVAAAVTLTNIKEKRWALCAQYYAYSPWTCDMALTLKSSAFAHGGIIPRKYTCDGMNVSPPLEWSGVPAGTNSLVLVCNDPDAPGGTFHHWAAFGIPPELSGLEEIRAGVQDGRFMQAMNDFGKPGYGGPCPPRGHKPHSYHFRLSALSGRLEALPKKVTCAGIIRHVRPLETSASELIGYYGRE